jgi:hypothetical protein
MGALVRSFEAGVPSRMEGLQRITNGCLKDLYSTADEIVRDLEAVRESSVKVEPLSTYAIDLT